MTKRTWSEFELGALPLYSDKGTGITTSEVEYEAAEGCLKECPVTIGGPKPQSPAKVAVADVEINEWSGDEVVSATEAVEGELETHPFWALLMRAGYEFI